MTLTCAISNFNITSDEIIEAKKLGVMSNNAGISITQLSTGTQGVPIMAYQFIM